MGNQELLIVGILLAVLGVLSISTRMIYEHNIRMIASKQFYIQSIRMCDMINDQLMMVAASQDEHIWALYHEYIQSNIGIVHRNLTEYITVQKYTNEITAHIEAIEAKFQAQQDFYTQLAKIPKTEEPTDE